MDLRLYPNARRPGIGQKPRRESQRPLLPQHSRHCPVLEAGSSLGFLVYPPLDTNESFVIEFQGEGRYQFTYMMKNPAGQWQPVFAIAMVLPVGGVGMLREDVTFMVRDAPLLREDARQLARGFIVPEDLGTPAGGVTLKGSTNFLTPQGWDTVYMPVLNNIERPVAPMLVVRVETDWYAHETEFRYVLQPGEAISAEHNLPIGQVFFVPREEITMESCTEAEIAILRESKAAFFREKAENRVTTPHGLHYSPHYLRESRARKT